MVLVYDPFWSSVDWFLSFGNTKLTLRVAQQAGQSSTAVALDCACLLLYHIHDLQIYMKCGFIVPWDLEEGPIYRRPPSSIRFP